MAGDDGGAAAGCDAAAGVAAGGGGGGAGLGGRQWFLAWFGFKMGEANWRFSDDQGGSRT